MLKHVCDYCGKDIGTPHFSIVDGRHDGFEYPGVFRVSITTCWGNREYDFCDSDCMNAGLRAVADAQSPRAIRKDVDELEARVANQTNNDKH